MKRAQPRDGSLAVRVGFPMVGATPSSQEQLRATFCKGRHPSPDFCHMLRACMRPFAFVLDRVERLSDKF